jgi:polyhydroxyalkanoate synthesis regulator phasin
MSADKDSKLGDVLKKVVSTGISAAFMTEEAVKNMVQDLPIPKEAINSLLANAKSTKDEFVGAIKNELKSHLDKIDVSKEIEKVLDKYDMEVNAKISFKKKKKETP